MAKLFAKGTRSYNMARIKSANTKPEMIVRRFLFTNGYRYRLHDKNLPGRPDIVLVKHKIVLQINGCFWHMHEGCKLNRLPKSRPEYWIPKLQGNVNRDVENYTRLKLLGWKVIVIWECELKPKLADETLKSLICNIKNNTHSAVVSDSKGNSQDHNLVNYLKTNYK